MNKTQQNPPKHAQNRNTLRYGLLLSFYCTPVDVFGNLRYKRSFSLLQVTVTHI
jgi:hypothetical protein